MLNQMALPPGTQTCDGDRKWNVDGHQIREMRADIRGRIVTPKVSP